MKMKVEQLTEVMKKYMKKYISLKWIFYCLVAQVFFAFVSFIALIIYWGQFGLMIFYDHTIEWPIIVSTIHVLPQYYIYKRGLPDKDLSLNIIISLLIVTVIFAFMGLFDNWNPEWVRDSSWEIVLPQNIAKVCCLTAVELAAFIGGRKWIIKIPKQAGNHFIRVLTFLPVQIITPFYTFFIIYAKSYIVRNDFYLMVFSAGLIHGIAHYIYCVFRKRKYGDDIVLYVIASMLLAVVLGFFIRWLLFLFTGPYSYGRLEPGVDYLPKDVLYHAPEIFLVAAALLLVLFVIEKIIRATVKGLRQLVQKSKV